MADTGLDDGMSHLAEYFGNYTSPLELDEKNFPWWENGDFAIWKNGGTWTVGLLADLGTENGVMKMTSDSPCPHPFGRNRTDPGWTYYQENVGWKQAGLLDILLIIGEFTLYRVLLNCFWFLSPGFFRVFLELRRRGRKNWRYFFIFGLYHLRPLFSRSKYLV